MTSVFKVVGSKRFINSISLKTKQLQLYFMTVDLSQSVIKSLSFRLQTLKNLRQLKGSVAIAPKEGLKKQTLVFSANK